MYLGLGNILCDIECNIPDQSEGTHSHRLQFRIPRYQVSNNIPPKAPSKAPIVNVEEQGIANRLVISKVVPKIWARTNSAMMKDGYARYTRKREIPIRIFSRSNMKEREDEVFQRKRRKGSRRKAVLAGVGKGLGEKRRKQGR
jgi:hypothetical protein